MSASGTRLRPDFFRFSPYPFPSQAVYTIRNMTGGEPAQQIRLKQEREADERLLIEAAQRERARFGDLYDRYFYVVYAYVARRVGQREAAEDVTSEVFRKALENLARFKWTGAPFGAWLLRIASNVIADRAKRAIRERVADLPPGAGQNQASSPPATQTDLEASERRAYLFRMVRELAEDQQRVVVMRFVEEKSIREIAAELKRTEGAVKQLQFRALQNLRLKFLSPGAEEKSQSHS